MAVHSKLNVDKCGLQGGVCLTYKNLRFSHASHTTLSRSARCLSRLNSPFASLAPVKGVAKSKHRKPDHQHRANWKNICPSNKSATSHLQQKLQFG